MNPIKLFILSPLLWLLSSNTETYAGAFAEGFETVNLLDDAGWIFDNQSDFAGDLSWGQGFSSIFPAQAGPENSFIRGAAGQTGGNVLCDWLILPDIGFVEQLNFFTRTVANSPSPDRLAVVHSPTGSVNTGPCVNTTTNQTASQRGGAHDFGDFELLTMVNPNLTVGGYPEQWTPINVPVDATGRLALVYFVTDVGQSPFNGNLIGIDSIGVGPGGPPPIGPGPAQQVPGLTFWGLLILPLLMILMLFRKHKIRQ